MSHYGSLEYWETRYRDRGSQLFEWYVPWERIEADVKEVLASVTSDSQTRYLVIGTGTSLIAERIYDFIAGLEAGPKDVIAMDWAQSVIETMADRAARQAEKRPQLRYLVGNVTRMDSIPSTSISAVFDKAVIDSGLCAATPDQARANCAALMKEVHRILKPGGVLIHVSHSKDTDGIKSAIFEPQGFAWADVSMIELETESAEAKTSENSSHFMFVFRKQ